MLLSIEVFCLFGPSHSASNQNKKITPALSFCTNDYYSHSLLSFATITFPLLTLSLLKSIESNIHCLELIFHSAKPSSFCPIIFTVTLCSPLELM
jgi:hypothetical protein